ncbi:protein-disulfide isomerase [Novosphingobium chloroacetimidivorans]|uniref:Protein-disulfide isomerase n=1 Tax=Novosphingobium chloroacetimidivorans TaxID=1428314 RepID=A0A7W7K7M2_9SPHN|nr:thioredoxin domain-containing protein [Novosphingobium chloroacetimidivorans]MBB4857712.1 protein-disulfide isomerase [Novosphingobium chloroacetimidivorans]
MIHRSILPISALAIATLLAPVASAAPAPANHGNWNAAIAQGADGSFTLGNPKAKVKLTEYVSYTCPHCAKFSKESEPLLRMSYVPQGKVAVTVTQVLRNPIDITIALLTNCGDPKTFFTRHNGFMASQDRWLARYESFSEAQTARWASGPVAARFRAIASDFDFYAIMARWSYSRAQVDRCLGDAAMLKRLTAQTEAASAKGVDSTPSFAIDGEVLVGTHDWKTLAAQIDTRL